MREPGNAAHRPTRRGRRRTVLTGVLGAASGALAACAQGAPPEAGGSTPARSAGFDWRRFTGQEIRVVYSGGRLEYYKTQLPEFERETGIKVQFETGTSAPDVTLREFVAGGSTIDAFVTNTVQDGVRYHRAKWYAPIDRLLADRSLTAPDYDLNEVFPGVLSTAKVPGTDTLAGVPNESQVAIVYYNKQHFAAADVPPPVAGQWRFEECEAAARRLHTPPNVAGWSSRTRASAFIVGFAKSLGAGWTDARGQLTFNSPEHVQAIDLYARLLRLYGADDPSEGEALFGRGAAAMQQEVNNRTARYTAVQAHVGFTTVPGGPRGAAPLSFSWCWAIHSGSKKQEAAWLWAQWITSKRQSIQGALQALLPSPRRSTYEDPEFKRKDPTPELTAVTMRSLQLPLAHGDWLPPVIDVPSAREVLDSWMGRAIAGESPRTVADEITRELRVVQERA